MTDNNKQLVLTAVILGTAVLLCVGAVTAAISLSQKVIELTVQTAPTPAPTDGVFVTAVVPGSPAELAGVRAGQTLLQINDRPITSPELLSVVLINLEPGEAIRLLLRDEAGTLRQTTAFRAAEPPYLGVELVDLPLITPTPASDATPTPTPTPTPTSPPLTNLPVILSVVPGSPASMVDLQAGDVITAVNGQAILNSQEMIDAIRQQQPGATVTLTIRRGTATLSRTAVLAANPDAPDWGFLGVEIQP